MTDVEIPLHKDGSIGTLPPICILCGAPATRTAKHNFASQKRGEDDSPNDKNLWVDVPLCDRHPLVGRGNLIIFLGLPIALGLVAITYLAQKTLHPVILSFPAFVIMLVAGVLGTYLNWYVLPTRLLTSRRVIMGDVNERFARACEEEWSDEQFEASLRKNNRAQGGPNPPGIWFHPGFFVPMGSALLMMIFAPIGLLVVRIRNGAPAVPPPAASRPVQPVVENTLRPAPPTPEHAADPVAKTPPVNKAEPKPAVDSKPPAEPQPPDPIKLPGLIAYWSLDEGKGEQATDTSGHKLTATVHNADWVDGIRGKALQFRGSGSYLELGSAPELSFPARSSFTLALWVRTRAGNGMLLAMRKQRDGSPLLQLSVEGQRIRALLRPDGNEFASPDGIVGSSVSDGRWHHVAFCREGEILQLYLDGVSQGTKQGPANSGALTTDLRALGAELFWIRVRGAIGTPDFAGSADELCVFNRALKPEEIRSLAGR